MHKQVDLKVLYFGTPVVIVSTLNVDGAPNLAPISSAWWLGGSGMFGMGNRSHTVANLRRTGNACSTSYRRRWSARWTGWR